MMDLIKFEVGQVWIDNKGGEVRVCQISSLNGVTVSATTINGATYLATGQQVRINGELMSAFLIGLKSDLVKEPEFEYPIFKRNVSSGKVYKFTSANVAETMNKSGDIFSHATAHTDSVVWQDVIYNEKRGLADKDAVIALIDDRFQYRLYDAKNDTLFYNGGGRFGIGIDRLYTEEEVKKELLERVE